MTKFHGNALRIDGASMALPLGQTPVGELATLDLEIMRGGVIAGLKFLNGRVPHRFTAVYKFQEDMQRCVFAYDKLGKLPRTLNELALKDGFCRFITAGKPFSHSLAPAATGCDGSAGHQNAMASYFGVALCDAAGNVQGSLCHFDPSPQAMPFREDVFLDQARHLVLAKLNGFGL